MRFSDVFVCTCVARMHVGVDLYTHITVSTCVQAYMLCINHTDGIDPIVLADYRNTGYVPLLALAENHSGRDVRTTTQRTLHHCSRLFINGFPVLSTSPSSDTALLALWRGVRLQSERSVGRVPLSWSCYNCDLTLYILVSMVNILNSNSIPVRTEQNIA